MFGKYLIINIIVDDQTIKDIKCLLDSIALWA